MIFYESPSYKKALELVRKYTTGLCMAQTRLPCGGVLEKWCVGYYTVLILCEKREYPYGDPFYTEVYVQAAGKITWTALEEKLKEFSGGDRVG